MVELRNGDVVRTVIPYRCKVQQLDALQHNGMTDSESEMCICWEHLEAHHAKSDVIRQSFLRKLSED